jgi:hypothetical protein
MGIEHYERSRLFTELLKQQHEYRVFEHFGVVASMIGAAVIHR